MVASKMLIQTHYLNFVFLDGMNATAVTSGVSGLGGGSQSVAAANGERWLVQSLSLGDGDTMIE